MLIAVLGRHQEWRLTEEPGGNYYVGQLFRVEGGDQRMAFQLLVPDLEPPEGEIQFFSGECQDDYDFESLDDLRSLVEAAVSGRVRVAHVGLLRRSPILHIQRDGVWTDLLNGKRVDYETRTETFAPYA